MTPSSDVNGAAETLEHHHNARGSFIHYLLVAGGALFVFAPFAITPETHCVEYPCPLWLRGVIFLLGAIFGGGALAAILIGTEWGSFIEPAKGEIVWWHGRPGCARKRIPIDRIGRIVVVDGDSVSLRLTDVEGRRILLPSECVKPPIAGWATEIGRRYPAIEVEIRE